MAAKVKGPPLLIGVDIGGVLSSKAKEYESDTNRLETEFDMPGCIEALMALKSKGHRLFIVSFCGERRAKETMRLYQEKYTHIFEDAFFVKKRPFKHDVAVYCGIDVMVDDRFDILKHMTTVHRIHFVGDLMDDIVKEAAQDKRTKRFTAKNWSDVVQIIDIPIFPRGNKPNPDVDIKKLCHCRYTY